MYDVLVSEGIVLGKRGVGEANILVSILTRNLGLIRARAQSARAEQSKLRYGLEPLTHGTFSFVRGKNEWRLVGVEKATTLLGKNVLSRKAQGRVTRLLSRLIHGEESLLALYTTVSEGLAYLARVQEKEEIESVECVLVLRILSHLGYLPQTPALAPFVESDFFSLELAHEAARSRRVLIRAINESLNATGL
jgi:DNA repair protein RecO